jgi:uncharacterized protein involved in tellurium resistance
MSDNVGSKGVDVGCMVGKQGGYDGLAQALG